MVLRPAQEGQVLQQVQVLPTGRQAQAAQAVGAPAVLAQAQEEQVVQQLPERSAHDEQLDVDEDEAQRQWQLEAQLVIVGEDLVEG